MTDKTIEEVSKSDYEDGPPCKNCNHAYLSHDDCSGTCDECECFGYEETETDD